MTTSPSYLQALPNDERLTFITSLQTVRDHLSQELQWLNEQVQQKTVQFQGIETLLSELSSAPKSKPLPQGVDVPTPPTTTASKPVLPPPSNTTMTTEAQASLMATLTNLPPKAKAQPSTAAPGRSKAGSSSTKSAAKSASSSKSSTKKKKKPSSAKSTSKTASSLAPSDLRQYLKPEFQSKTFGDTAAQILAKAGKPLHLDDLLYQMYGELAHQTFERAKVSLANVLSTGAKQGRWKGDGKGMYTLLKG